MDAVLQVLAWFAVIGGSLFIVLKAASGAREPGMVRTPKLQSRTYERYPTKEEVDTWLPEYQRVKRKHFQVVPKGANNPMLRFIVYECQRHWMLCWLFDTDPEHDGTGADPRFQQDYPQLGPTYAGYPDRWKRDSDNPYRLVSPDGMDSVNYLE